MESNREKVWYSTFGGELPKDIGYCDTDDFPWVKHLEDNWTVIRAEVDSFLERHEERLIPYFNKKMVSAPRKWKAFAFCFWRWSVPKNMRECPQTVAILREVPGLLSASISILEPNTEIHEHRGDTNAIFRGHLGLRIPEGLPAVGFSVSEEVKPWEEGKVLLFSDASKHKAWNKSSERRYVLLFDVIRPEFAGRKYRVSATVLTGLLMQAYVQKAPFIRKLPKLLLAPFFFLNFAFVFVALRTRNLFSSF